MRAETPRLLIIGDHPLVADVGRRSSNAGIDVVAVAARSSAAAETAKQFRPHLALLVAELEESTALELSRAVLRACRCHLVLLADEVTGATLTLADHCDADTVLCPPVDPTQLERMMAEPVVDDHGGGRVVLPEVVVGSSRAMRDLWRLTLIAARSPSSVIITGETGVGKEVVARAMHRFSMRRHGPFVAVNCGALPENLLESELFGHEKGAFTGASARHKGRFEMADGGTLLLDEIGDLSLDLQVKLLRVLQEQTIERVGGTQSVQVDVRVLAATHRNLAEAREQGTFRSDLFYRLNVMTIEVPPLRQRKDDLLALWRYFVDAASSQAGRVLEASDPGVERALVAYAWPGNVRELHNAALHAVMVAKGRTISRNDLPPPISGIEGKRKVPSLVGFSLREIERAAILETCAAMDTVKAAADTLGISPRKVYYRLKEYRQEDERQRQEQARRELPEEVAEPARAQEPAAPALEAAAAKPQRKRVLLAEDDDDLRYVLSGYLGQQGFDVISVPSGTALLEHLGAALLFEKRDAPPDIIISDVRMPGMSGMDILESVRGRGWSTPVVLMSAFGDDETRERASALGAAAFIDKPIDRHQLEQIIESSLTH